MTKTMTPNLGWVTRAAALSGALLFAGCHGGISEVPSNGSEGVTDGGLRCCTPGGAAGEVSGVTCRSCPAPTCTGASTEKPGVTCIPPQKDGGIYGHCIEDGAEIEGKVIGAYCCNRIEQTEKLRGRVASEAPAAPGASGADARGCAPKAPPSVSICSRCGDGACAAWENRCNCPEDCK